MGCRSGAPAAVLLLLAWDQPVRAQYAFRPIADQPIAGQSEALLADPGDYSFAPPAATPGGVASFTYGSRHTSGASIRMDSGLIGNTGMQAFVALGGGRGPDLRRWPEGGRTGGVTSHEIAAGVEKTFADGTTITLQGGWEKYRLPSGGPRFYSADRLP